ncbi:MAG: hypothetical protein HZB26_24375 [Candidatus Hydrogenedentes bacterium]|nr:hypothetical protein [Candidatus Hydrogenedentota bacterium]
MTDEMFFSVDERSLRRGRRIARRTPTCRACLVWSADAPEHRLQGVVMDINPFGMLIRMLDYFPMGTAACIQLMRDEDFEIPLAGPLEGAVVRVIPNADGFTDIGVRIKLKEIPRAESRPIRIERRRPLLTRRSRMHTIDFTVGDRGGRRTGG